MADTAEFTRARIRVSRKGALILLDALEFYEVELLQERRSDPSARVDYNAALKELRWVLDETTRTIEERGWDKDDGELFGSDEG